MKVNISNIGFTLKQETSRDVKELLKGDRFCLLTYKYDKARIDIIRLLKS